MVKSLGGSPTMPKALVFGLRLVPYMPLAALLCKPILGKVLCNAIRAQFWPTHAYSTATQPRYALAAAPPRAQPPEPRATALRDPTRGATGTPASHRAATIRRLVVLLATSYAFKQQRDDNKPRGKRNVLFMIADDLRPQLGHLGHSDVDTPQIDRLAKTGVSFRRAYCQAPACNPSRNSFLTGMYPDVSKVFTSRRNSPHTRQRGELTRLYAYAVPRLHHHGRGQALALGAHRRAVHQRHRCALPEMGHL